MSSTSSAGRGGKLETSVKYGFRHRWMTLHGAEELSTSGHASRDDAKRALMAALPTFGWAPPRWWEFWRWAERRL